MRHRSNARQTLQPVQRGVGAARRAERCEVGELLLVGYEASSAYNALPRALKVFREQVPGIEVTLEQMDTDEQAQVLKDVRIQLGFVVPPLHDKSWQAEVGTRELLEVALSCRHRLAHHMKADLYELVNEPFVMSPRAKRYGCTTK